MGKCISASFHELLNRLQCHKQIPIDAGSQFKGLKFGFGSSRLGRIRTKLASLSFVWVSFLPPNVPH